MKLINYSKYFVFISVLTAAAIFFIIFNGSYNNLIKPLNEIQTSNLLKSFDAKLDLDTINKINQREEMHE